MAWRIARKCSAFVKYSGPTITLCRLLDNYRRACTHMRARSFATGSFIRSVERNEKHGCANRSRTRTIEHACSFNDVQNWLSANFLYVNLSH